MGVLAMIVMTDDEVATYGRASDASFGALRTARGLLPLTAMDVDIKVAGVVASTEVAQTYVNTTGTAIEATYIFPLPDRAAVHRFRMEVAGRVIEGVVEERGLAREQYEQAIHTGHRAAITEEERPGVFTMRVGNLMPGEAATVRLSLVGPLPVDDGAITLRFPLVVAPRYMPGTSLGGDQAGLGSAVDTTLVPDASRISPPVLLPGCPNPVRLGLRVAIHDRGVANVLSSLHAVTQMHADAHVVEVRPGERLDRDFILRWRIDGTELRSSLACEDDADGRGGSFMLTLMPPNTETVAAKPRDVIFVLDRSGSMGGWKMVAARRAVARMIDTLTARDRFRVIAFDDVVENIPDWNLTAATDRHRFRAVEALAKIDARNGTEMMHPLRSAVQALAGGTLDRERVVVLVTDGQVGNEDHILRELAPQMRNVKMFALGIDQAVNAAFLRRLASSGGGLCELVESEDALDAVMSKVHRRIGTPIATELQLSGLGVELDYSSISPKKLPDVYAGAPVVIFGRYRGTAPSAQLEVSGTQLGEPMRVAVSRDIGVPPAPSGASWLAASWARAHIRDLEDRYAAGASQLEPSIVDVSKRYSVLSRFTAFVAIDRAEIVNRGGRLHQAVQPVEQPAGWGGGMMGAMPMGGLPGGAPMGRPGGAPPPPMGPSANTLRRAPSAGYAGMPAPPPAQSSAPVSRAVAGARPPRPTEAMPSMPAMPPPMAPAPQGSPRAMPPARSAYDDDDDARGSGAPSDASYNPPPDAPAYDASPSFSYDAADDFDLAHSESMSVPTEELERRAPSDRYLDSLRALAIDLDRHAQTGNRMQIALIRTRLVEWVEDYRSVSGNAPLPDAVEQLCVRLAEAMASSPNLTVDVIAIAAELRVFADGGPVPTTPPRTRQAFWK